MRSSPAVSAGSPLLRFAAVGRRVRDGERLRALLREASFELDPGASAGIYGPPRSGKSTLMRLACGLETADSGAVSFDGRDLANIGAAARAQLLRDEVALVCDEAWRPAPGETALGRVVSAIGATGATVREARRRGLAALDALDVAGIAAEPASSLSRGQRARVELACAFAREPRLLLLDEPAPTPSVTERERLCAAIRRLAQERGVALLVASEDLASLQGLQTMMSISAGELCRTGEAESKLVSLAARRAASGR